MEPNEMQPEDSIIEVAKRLTKIDGLLEEINKTMQSKEQSKSLTKTIEAPKVADLKKDAAADQPSAESKELGKPDASEPSATPVMPTVVEPEEAKNNTTASDEMQQKEEQFNNMMSQLPSASPVNGEATPIQTAAQPEPVSTKQEQSPSAAVPLQQPGVLLTTAESDLSQQASSNTEAKPAIPEQAVSLPLPAANAVDDTFGFNTVAQVNPEARAEFTPPIPMSTQDLHQQQIDAKVDELLQHPMHKAFEGPRTAQNTFQSAETATENIEKTATDLKKTTDVSPVKPSEVFAKPSAKTNQIVSDSPAVQPVNTAKNTTEPATTNTFKATSKPAQLPVLDKTQNMVPPAMANKTVQPSETEPKNQTRPLDTTFKAQDETKPVTDKPQMNTMDEQSKAIAALESKDKSMVNLEKNISALTANLNKSMTQLTTQLNELNAVATQILNFLPSMNAGQAAASNGAPGRLPRTSDTVLGGSINQFREKVSGMYSGARPDNKFTLT